MHALEKWLAIWFVILIAPALGAQEIILEHADSSRLLLLGDSSITYFYGLTKQVHFRQASAEIFADTVLFHSTGFYVFIGNVHYADTLRTIYAQYLLYERASEIFRGRGDVRLVDIAEALTLDGDSVEFDNRAKELMVRGSTRVVFNINDVRRTIDVSSDSLRYLPDQKYAEAYGEVNIIKGNLSATCGLARLLPDSGQLILTENPQALQLDNQVSGDSMTIYLRDDLVDHIDIDGEAEALYRQRSDSADSLYTESTLKAKRIVFILENEALVRIFSAGNSYSEYIPVSADSLSSGRNLASGDSIKLFFEDNRLELVEIITSCEGQYFSSGEKDSLGRVLEDTINYRAERLKYLIDRQDINLYDAAQIKHQSVILDADTIIYNTRTKILRARSFWSYPPEGDSVYHPVILRDGTEEILGESLSYNVDTRRGKIKESDTKMENAFYHGEIIRKEDEDVLLVEGGSYIPCEYRDANFHFYSNNMKLIKDDRVIARPIVLYIEKIPVFYLPYFVFSIRKDRHSGFLPFQIGNFERGSRFVNNLGYYWALSDYYDLETSLDYNDEVGVTFNLGVRYALRYHFDGSFSGSYSRESTPTLSGENRRNRWRIDVSHSHILTETSSLRGSGNFQSDADYITDISTDPEERLNRILRSQLNFSKRWGRTSFSAAVDGTKNLDTENTTYGLPILSFSIPSREVFPAGKAETKHWFQNLYLTYRVGARNYISNSGSGDSRARKHFSTAEHDIGLSMPTNIFRYFTISPTANLTESWFYIFDTDLSREKGLLSERPMRRGVYSFGMSAKTNIYGLFRPPISGLVGLRHVLTPSFSFTYRPKSERHAEEASYTGVRSGGMESQSLGVSLGNLFQLKYKRGEATHKLDLFTLNFSASYNFKSTAYKWSALQTSLRSSTIPHLSFTVDATHDLYNRQTQKLDVLHARLTSISFAGYFSYSGEIKAAGSPTEGCLDCDSADIKFPSKPSKYPWDLSFGYRYAETRGDFAKSITHWLTMDMQFNLTPNWKVAFTQNYNIRAKELTERSFSFYRDMRCWEAVFYWIPSGSRQGYYFRIALKQIPDIKLEKSESGIRSPLTDPF